MSTKSRCIERNVVLKKFEYLNTFLILFLDTAAVEGKVNDIQTALDEDYNANEYNVYDMDGHDDAPGPGLYYIYNIKFPLLYLNDYN